MISPVRQASLSNQLEISDDFCSLTRSPYVAAVSGGTCAILAPVANHPCLDQCGASAVNDRAGVTIDSQAFLLQGPSYFESVAAIVTLSDATNRFFVLNGLHDRVGGSGEPTDGCYFRYQDNTNSGNWQLICRSNTTETPINSSIPPVAGTYQRFQIFVNAGASSVTGYIDGVSVGSAITSASSLPTGAGREFGAGIKIEKSVGSAGRNINIDYIQTIIGGLTR
jgi:hypothetical protein